MEAVEMVLDHFPILPAQMVESLGSALGSPDDNREAWLTEVLNWMAVIKSHLSETLKEIPSNSGILSGAGRPRDLRWSLVARIALVGVIDSGRQPNLSNEGPLIEILINCLEAYKRKHPEWELDSVEKSVRLAREAIDLNRLKTKLYQFAQHPELIQT